MQAARGPIHLRVELSPRVQRAHDYFERGFVLELRVRIDGNAAPIVGHGDEAVGLHLDLDKLACPASASSMELSITSAKRWCSAFSSVPPIYMPGRRRTGSRPSSTSMSRAV